MSFLALISYLPINPLISIKLFSILFDYLCAIFAVLILGELIKNDKNKKLYMIMCYTAIIFSPSVK